MANRSSSSDNNNDTSGSERRQFLRLLIFGGATLFAAVTLGGMLTRRQDSEAVAAAASGGAIKLVTLEDIVAGKIPSATKTGGNKFTKTTGLNGTMVEVQNVKIVSVSGPAHDTDFHIVISDGGKQTSFLTENIRFPLRTGPYLVSNPNKGDVVNMVGTAYHDGNHWEIHPIFAWKLASKGLVTSVCAPAGTVSKTQQICWSGTA